MIKYDLQKMTNNSFDAAVKNLEASNNVFYEFERQLFSVSTFYFIFLATLFFFLKDYLSIDFIHLKISFWLAISFVSGSISFIMGLFGLWLDKVFLLSSARKHLAQSEKILGLIKKYNTAVMDEVPDELKDMISGMTSCKFTNLLIIGQFIFFIIMIISTLTPIIFVILK